MCQLFPIVKQFSNQMGNWQGEVKVKTSYSAFISNQERDYQLANFDCLISIFVSKHAMANFK